jgi:hypothetical protein
VERAHCDLEPDGPVPEARWDEVRHLQRDLSRLEIGGHAGPRGALGYAGLEIAPFTLANSVNEISAAERQRIRDLAARQQIAIVGLHWLLVKPEGLYLNHTDAGIRERTAKYFVDLVDCCADFGGTIMVVGSPKQRNIFPASPASRRGIGPATFPRRREARGRPRVTICFEPLAPAKRISSTRRRSD